MSPSAMYAELSKFSVITVDVFDTILLRKIYPEALQFRKGAVHAQTLLADKLQVQFSSTQWASLRQTCRDIITTSREFQNQYPEPPLADVFSLMLDTILRQNNLYISSDEKNELIKQLISFELQVERQFLICNDNLVTVLKQCQQNGARIYFVSDMYLSAKHVWELFEAFGITDVFAGGFTSSDQQAAKSRGELFPKLRDELLPDVDFTQAIHIGDMWWADVQPPKQIGMRARLYETRHHRVYRQRTKRIGRYRWGARRWWERRKIRRAFRQHLHQQKKQFASKETQITYEFGYWMGSALIWFGSYLGMVSELLGCPIILVSREGLAIHQLLARLGYPHDDDIVFANLNRVRMLRAYLYSKSQQGRINLPELMPILSLRGRFQSSQDLLNVLGVSAEQVGFRDEEITTISPEDLLVQLEQSDARYNTLIDRFQQEHEQVMAKFRELGFFDQPLGIVADVGWRGTIQLLFERTLKIDNIPTNIQGIYLGFSGRSFLEDTQPHNRRGVLFNSQYEPRVRAWLVEEVWEAILSQPKPSADDVLSSTIWQGMNDFIEYFCSSPHTLDPQLCYQATSRYLRRQFIYPNHARAQAVGKLPIDIGYGGEVLQTLIDPIASTPEVWGWLLRDNRKFRKAVFSGYWASGFLAWHRLRFLQMIVDRYYRRKREN